MIVVCLKIFNDIIHILCNYYHAYICSTSAKYNKTMNLYVNNYITQLVCSEVGQVRPTSPIVSWLPIIGLFFKTSLTAYIRIPRWTHKECVYATKYYGVHTCLFFDVVCHAELPYVARGSSLSLVDNNGRWRGFDSCFVAAFHPLWQIYVPTTL